jgi:hypothetical protein
VKFLLLMTEADHFENWENADTALQERVAADFEAFVTAVAQRGSLVLGEALDRPSAARTVRPGSSRPVTDGPYAETAEQLGGVWVIDVPSRIEALDLARLLPVEYSIEVRPIIDTE